MQWYQSWVTTNARFTRLMIVTFVRGYLDPIVVGSVSRHSRKLKIDTNRIDILQPLRYCSPTTTTRSVAHCGGWADREFNR